MDRINDDGAVVGGTGLGGFLGGSLDAIGRRLGLVAASPVDLDLSSELDAAMSRVLDYDFDPGPASEISEADLDGSTARPLTLWRWHPPYSTLRDVEVVQAAVIDVLESAGQHALADGIRRGDPESAFDAAFEAASGDLSEVIASLGYRRAEWDGSCLWLVLRSGRLGRRVTQACVGLIMAFANHIAGAEDDAERQRLADLMRSVWTEYGGNIIEDARFSLPRSRSLAARGDAPPAEMLGAAPTPAGAPMLRVVARIAGGAADADGIARRFAALTEPLPLTPMPDPDAVRVAILDEFPWMPALAERVAADIRFGRLLGGRFFRLRPVLLVGPPGVGKTRVARRIAEIVGSPYGSVNAAGSSDNRNLQGTAAGYNQAQPAYPLIVMASSRCASPLIAVDELDKASPDTRHGRIWDTLLTMLEPETSRRWPDECLVANADLGAISWVMTANTVEGLPDALLSRVGVVEVGRPAPEHFDPVLDAVLADFGEEYGQSRAVGATLRALLDGDALHALRTTWAVSSSPRRLKGLVQAALSAVAGEVGRH